MRVLSEAMLSLSQVVLRVRVGGGQQGGRHLHGDPLQDGGVHQRVGGPGKQGYDSQTIDAIIYLNYINNLKCILYQLSQLSSSFSPAVCPAGAVGGVQGQAGGRARGLRAAPSIRFAP